MKSVYIKLKHTYSLSHSWSSQVACQSASDALANRKRFRFYFQILETANVAAYGFFAIIREFGWRRVIILEQNESIFTRVSDETRAFRFYLLCLS